MRYSKTKIRFKSNSKRLKFYKERSQKINKKLTKKLRPQKKYQIQFSKGFSKKLQNKKPKSEVWFENQMNFASLYIDDLLNNEVFLGYIPDYISHDYKVIIEVDGNWHENKEVLEKDAIKQDLYTQAGYSVIRVKAYCDKSLYNCFTKLQEILNE
jgi:very-short-patch-repair endonuclease